jgi:hypothetical protein
MIQIIFSKNRALQLEACLRSMRQLYSDYYKNINIVLYTYTDNEYKEGYDKLISEYKDFIFIRETVLKDDILDILLNNENEKYVVFYCDDDIWKEPFNNNFKEFDIFDKNEKISCYSLRLHPKIIRCYTQNTNTAPPKFYSDEILVWNWIGLPADWGYPMSVDGHIFKLDYMITLLRRLSFTNVTLLEANMALNEPKDKPYMICNLKSNIMNIPLNSINNNPHMLNMHVDPKSLNNLFLSGKIIDTKSLEHFENISAHQEVKLNFIGGK